MGFDQSNIDDLLREAGLGASGGASGGAGGKSSVDSVLGSAGGGGSGAQPARFQSFDSGGSEFTGEAHNIDQLLGDVQLKVQILLGKSKMSVEDILQLSNGSVVELDKLAGDPLDILVNDRLVAKGEVLVLNDNFCIRVTDIIPPTERS